MEVSDFDNLFYHDFWKEFDWREDSFETNDKFIKFFNRVESFYTPDEYDVFVRLFDCFDPFCNSNELVVWRILKLIGYAHWNQYYFEHMPDQQLLGLCNSKIKEYQNKLELLKIQEDF